MIVAASGGASQPPTAAIAPHPDAVRLLGSITPTGIPLQAPARVFQGDHWRHGRVVATGATWCAVSMERHGIACVRDRRNILVGEEWSFYEAACRQWRREQKKRNGGEA